MSRPKDPTPILDDIQIRLYVVLGDTLWVTSYYGSEDEMRFAALRYPKKCELSVERYTSLEVKARRLFTKKIKELNSVLSGLVQPSHDLEEILSQKQPPQEAED